MPSLARSYRAAYVLPIDRPPIHDGVVTVSDGEIVAVEKFSPSHRTENLLDLGDTAIIPALVNAHTHLEFSHLEKPLGHPGIPFTDWIRAIIATRSATSSTAAAKQASIRRGLQESVQSGVGHVGEIATAPITPSDYLMLASGKSSIETTVFIEQLGRSKDQFAEKTAATKQTLEQIVSGEKNAPSKNRPGISPHAPYSTSPSLVDALCQLAVATNVPLAMHVAETPEERELLEHQTGPLVELLKDLGVWDLQSFLPPRSILGILNILSATPRSLVIHGNDLNPDEIELIAHHRQRMSVVYCPRTHDYFRHAPYPLESLLSAGICVAIGTDSRASNPDLNLFSDLKHVASKFPHRSPLDILRLGTLNGAGALGVATTFGSITKGKRAALSLISNRHLPFPHGSGGAGQSNKKNKEEWDWLLAKEAVCTRLC